MHVPVWQHVEPVQVFPPHCSYSFEQVDGTGLGAGLGVGLGTGLGVGLGTGLGTGLGVGLGTGLGVGLDIKTHSLHFQYELGAGLGAGLGDGLGDGLGAGLGAGLGDEAIGLTCMFEYTTYEFGTVFRNVAGSLPVVGHGPLRLPGVYESTG